MRSVAALYDIHANLPALEAVLEEVKRERPDLIVVGGDVAAGPMPAETVSLLMGLHGRARFVRGNADRELVAAAGSATGVPPAGDPAGRAAAWAAQRLSAEQIGFLASFESVVHLSGLAVGDTLFCHGSPRSDEEIITSLTPDPVLGEMLADVAEPVIVCGHTHVGFDRELGRRRVLNAGSVGMPYEGRAGAFWLLLDESGAQLRHTALDIDEACARIRATGWPDADETLAEIWLRPADPAWVAAFFERQAGRPTT